MAIHTLHTKLRVADLTAGIRFYERAFGYTLRSRRPGPEGSEIAFLVLPGEVTELQLSQVADNQPFEVPARLMHLAYRVDALDDVILAAVAAGATLVSGPYTLPSGSIVAFLRDPHGYDLELVQKTSLDTKFAF